MSALQTVYFRIIECKLSYVWSFCTTDV